MKKNRLGRTGLEVTELCFGALPFGPLQKGLPTEVCAEVVESALRCGINFVDTAHIYGTYDPIRIAMKRTGILPIIASKSIMPDYDGMQKAIDEALLKLDIETIDIFHLHAARADNTVFQQRAGALRCLEDNKKSGKIRAIGISSHSVLAVEAAAQMPTIDVVFPILNITGTGILHGSRDDMEKAIAACAEKGKGIYLMKALAGGSLIGRFDEAMAYARSIPGVASIAVGMVSPDEVAFNLGYFSGKQDKGPAIPIPEQSKKQFIVVKTLCSNCGACRTTCPNEAIIEKEGLSFIQEDKCLTCGYCVGSCPMFAIRMV
jgi:predicted aldo/keto reductase-like oxidoreductase